MPTPTPLTARGSLDWFEKVDYLIWKFLDYLWTDTGESDRSNTLLYFMHDELEQLRQLLYNQKLTASQEKRQLAQQHYIQNEKLRDDILSSTQVNSIHISLIRTPRLPN